MTYPDNDSTRLHLAIYKPRIEIIQKVVSDYEKIPLHLMQQHNRKGEILRARQHVHYLCSKLVPNAGQTLIGKVTGNGKPFNHASISHSVKMVTNDLERKTITGRHIYPEVVILMQVLKQKSIANISRAKRIPYHYRIMIFKVRKFRKLLLDAK